jgi:hypothetical protein
MVLFCFIFQILVAPIGWLSNLLARRKTNLLEWHLFYGPYFVKIQAIHKEKSLSDDLLIASYIMFLGRYFYICDDRQVDVARDFLLDFVRRAQDPNEITAKLYEAIFKTLNPTEQDAAIKFFKIHSRFTSVPPLTYSEDKEPSHSYAKYSFYIIESARPASIFDMSAGPDMILLPVTVGILYKYVVDKIQNKVKKEKLDQSIIDLLEGYNSVDCRSQDGFSRLELLEKIILKHDLKWK